MSNEPYEPVQVHVVKDSTKTPGPDKPAPTEINATFATFSVGAGADAVLILPHAPGRTRAMIQFSAAGPVSLGPTKADAKAQGNGTAAVQSAAAGWLELHTTREVWGFSSQAGATGIAVIQEFGGP